MLQFSFSPLFRKKSSLDSLQLRPNPCPVITRAFLSAKALRYVETSAVLLWEGHTGFHLLFSKYHRPPYLYYFIHLLTSDLPPPAPPCPTTPSHFWKKFVRYFSNPRSPLWCDFFFFKRTGRLGARP